jgi:hypothetical protein
MTSPGVYVAVDTHVPLNVVIDTSVALAGTMLTATAKIIASRTASNATALREIEFIGIPTPPFWFPERHRPIDARGYWTPQSKFSQYVGERRPFISLITVIVRLSDGA